MMRAVFCFLLAASTMSAYSAHAQTPQPYVFLHELLKQGYEIKSGIRAGNEFQVFIQKETSAYFCSGRLGSSADDAVSMGNSMCNRIRQN